MQWDNKRHFAADEISPESGSESNLVRCQRLGRQPEGANSILPHEIQAPGAVLGVVHLARFRRRLLRACYFVLLFFRPPRREICRRRDRTNRKRNCRGADTTTHTAGADLNRRAVNGRRDQSNYRPQARGRRPAANLAESCARQSGPLESGRLTFVLGAGACLGGRVYSNLTKHTHTPCVPHGNKGRRKESIDQRCKRKRRQREPAADWSRAQWASMGCARDEWAANTLDETHNERLALAARRRAD